MQNLNIGYVSCALFSIKYERLRFTDGFLLFLLTFLSTASHLFLELELYNLKRVQFVWFLSAAVIGSGYQTALVFVVTQLRSGLFWRVTGVLKRGRRRLLSGPIRAHGRDGH